MNLRTIWVAALAGVVALSIPADARASILQLGDGIGVSFHNATEQPGGLGLLAWAGDSDLGWAPWNARRQYWNNLAGDWNIGSGLQTNLMNHSGGTTNASVAWHGLAVAFGDWPESTTDGTMMNGVLMSDGGVFGPLTTGVDFFNVQCEPGLKLRVIVYGEWDWMGASQTITLTAGGHVQTLFMTDQQAMNPGGFIDPIHYIDATVTGIGNYVVFDLIDSPNFSIVADAGSQEISYISGIQVFAIPAPGVLALLIIAGFRTTRRRCY